MRVFVTGGTGFIGSHVLVATLAGGHEVVAHRLPGTTPQLPLPREPIWCEGSLEEDWSRQLRRCSALVHIAAVGVDPSAADWDTCFRVNVTASLVLWQQAVACGVRRLVICGSCSEYGLSGERYEFVPTEAPLLPHGPYAASKAAATLAAIGLCAEQSLHMAILRPFQVFGPGELPHRLWPSLHKAAVAGQDYPMTPGAQVRDFVAVEEVARQFLRQMECDDLPPGRPRIRNVGSGRPRTVLEFATEWWERWKAPGRLLPGALPYRPGEVMRYVPRLDD